jgi:hypothetical protein
MDLLSFEINLDSSLDAAVFERMKERYEKAPEKAKKRFDLSNKDLSQHNERVARIHCFVEKIFEELNKQNVSENRSICFIKKIEDDLDLPGNLTLGILKTRELSIEYQGSIKKEYQERNPQREVYFAKDFEKGQYFYLQNLTIKEAKMIRSYDPQSNKSKVSCCLSSDRLAQP